MIYEAPNYKQFLRKELDSPRFGRGSRSQLADAIGVKPSFLSAVLNGQQDLSPEHVLRVVEFLGYGEDEAEFLLLLLHRDRAGSTSLRALYENQIDKLRKQKASLTEKLKRKSKSLEETELFEYYSSWRPVAVHMALRIPAYRGDPHAIASYLGISFEEAQEALETLQKLGFAERKGDRYLPLESLIHTPRSSAALRLHHTNWRIEALRSIANASKSDFHYSVTMSIDRKTAEKIEKLMAAAISEAEPVIREAKDEEIYAWSVDLFRVGSDRKKSK